MGIPGLLEHLRSITEKKHLSEYKGKRAAVDAHCWLHRAKFSCITELMNGIETDKFVAYFMDMINLLITHGIKPLIVFDGRQLPAKCEKNEERKIARENSRVLADEAISNGDEALAYSYMKKCVGVSSKMVHQLINVLKAHGIEYMVSPYESDAQLAFLSRMKLVDLVITEDSDAIVYGCSRTLFKLNRDTAMGDEIVRANMGFVTELSFSQWSDDQFKLFCCLSGCDYLNKLKNMGIKTAYQVVKDHQTLDKVISSLRRSRFAALVDDHFVLKLEQAWLTFKHQLVYDPTTKELQNLRPITDMRGYTNMDKFLGEHMEPDVLHAIVDGSLDPHKMIPYEASSTEIVNDAEAVIFKPVWRTLEEPPKEQQKNIWSFGISSAEKKQSNQPFFEKSPAYINSEGLDYFSPSCRVQSQLNDVNTMTEADGRLPSSSKKGKVRSTRKGLDFFDAMIGDDQLLVMRSLPDSLHRSKRSRMTSVIHDDLGSNSVNTHYPADECYLEDVLNRVSDLPHEKCRNKSLPFFQPRKMQVKNDPSSQSPPRELTAFVTQRYEEDLKENSQPEVENRPDSISYSHGGLFINHNNDISKLLYPERIVVQASKATISSSLNSQEGVDVGGLGKSSWPLVTSSFAATGCVADEVLSPSSRVFKQTNEILSDSQVQEYLRYHI
jgi:exonuclease 1